MGLLLQHIGTSAIMDLLLRLLTCVERPQLRQDVVNVSMGPGRVGAGAGVGRGPGRVGAGAGRGPGPRAEAHLPSHLQWLNEEKIVQRLIEQIHPSKDDNVSVPSGVPPVARPPAPLCTSRHPEPLPPRKVNSRRGGQCSVLCVPVLPVSPDRAPAPAGTCLMSQELGPVSLGRMGVWRGSQTPGSSLAPLAANLPGAPSQLPFRAPLLTGTWPLPEAPVAGHTLLVPQRTHAVASRSRCSPGGSCLVFPGCWLTAQRPTGAGT